MAYESAYWWLIAGSLVWGKSFFLRGTMLTGKISRMGKRYCAITLCLFIFAMLLEVPKGYAAIPLSSEPDTDSRVAQIMQALSPEQRVGQLFVVTFDGSTISPESAVYSLVGRYGIGGVMLAAEHDNFDDREDVLLSTRNLVTDLQQLAWQASQTRADDGTINTETTSEEAVYLPLLVGLTHQGGGPSYSALHSGLTSAPSAMAIGATWDVGEAGRIGEIAGFELNALGINLQLGPMLDVMEYPRAGNPGDPGVRSFGGSGYWVGEFAREYVAGVHRGSQGRIALVGQSFPGLGSGDRETVFDIPTVNKSLQDLLTVDLSPFFAVTASSPGDDAAIDVLMPAQGRYSAWQGALSSDTRPLGMDGAALGEVLRNGQLTDWRQQGGVIMSAPLGWRGVRRYYDPTGNTFPAFEIARDALLAGNDVLFVDQFAVDSSEGQYQTVVDTIDGFVRKYREDAAFAERVDGAVESIIALKLRLYGNDVSVDNVIGDEGLRDIGASEGDVFSLARQSVTLLSPHLSELANRLPRPPSRLERIVIFTDSSVGRQCSGCPKVSYPAVDALENAIGRLYGFVGSRQISGLDVFSFSFAELEGYLDGVDLLETPSAPPASTAESVDATPAETAVPELTIRDALPSARWLVFALGDVPAENAEANALRRFLAEKPELLTDRNVIVLALSAPYYLDATEVAQLTAYYGLYGHSSAFIEVAARVLFQEIVPHHAPPVSVKSVSYDLIGQLAADPGQSFSLSGVIPSEEAVIEGQSPAPDIGTEDSGADLTGATPWSAEAASEGSAILLNTSVLMDKNGHVIPDGTVVEFEASYLAEGGLTETFAASGSVQGVASATLVLERVGLVEISARAGDAQSAALVIDVRMNEGETLIQVQTITPTSTPVLPVPTTVVPTIVLTSMVPTGPPTEKVNLLLTEETIAPTVTPVIRRTVPPVLEATPVPTVAKATPGAAPHIDPRDLLSATLAMVVLSGAAWSAARVRGLSPLLRTRFRLLLYVTVGVWAGYDYYALQLPGSAFFRGMGGMAPALFSWGGGISALLIGMFWRGKLFERVRDSD